MTIGELVALLSEYNSDNLVVVEQRLGATDVTGVRTKRLTVRETDVLTDVILLEV